MLSSSHSKDTHKCFVTELRRSLVNFIFSGNLPFLLFGNCLVIDLATGAAGPTKTYGKKLTIPKMEQIQKIQELLPLSRGLQQVLGCGLRHQIKRIATMSSRGVAPCSACCTESSALIRVSGIALMLPIGVLFSSLQSGLRMHASMASGLLWV